MAIGLTISEKYRYKMVLDRPGAMTVELCVSSEGGWASTDANVGLVIANNVGPHSLTADSKKWQWGNDSRKRLK